MLSSLLAYMWKRLANGYLLYSPTGPKSMRNDSRNKRLFGQMTKALDRSGEAGIHRVRAHQGTERINGHSRDPPKGPRMNANRGPRLVTNRPMGGGMPPNGMASSAPAAALMGMSPQQQMQLFAMYEEQARMMSQILSPQQQQQMFMGPGFNPAMGGIGGPGTMGPGPGPGPSPQFAASGRSLFERIEHPPHPHQQQQHRNGAPGRRPSGNMPSPHPTGPSPNQATAGNPPNNELSSSMEVVPSQEPTDDNPATTICRFNLTCTKEDCAYAHQSPAAPAGTTIDVTDECSFGAACKNRKCVARHPSPAKKSHHQSEQDCKFFPHCTNPTCPFRHPTMPLCRNGADCTRPGCRFTHVKAACKYNPCLNPACPYKHVDGQKRGAFDDKVWVAEGANEKPHVSERKFVSETGGEEELIIPASSPPPTSQAEAAMAG